jgi:putative ABC transport system permease protein
VPAFESFAQDLRYTLRGLRAKPGFTAAVIITLALGIGANAAMFGIVDRMLFRPPPLMRDPATAHRIYTYQTFRGKERASGGFQFARFLDLAHDTRSFTSMAGYTRRDIAVGIGDAAREMSIAAVSANFFGFFDAPPVLGRYFTAAEDSTPSGQPVVVLSHAFWSTHFGERHNALGEKVQIGPVVFTVVGVAPSNFVGLWTDKPPAAYIPITNYGATQATGFTWLKKGTTWWRTYSWGWMSVIARRKANVTIHAANADLTNAMRHSYQTELLEHTKSPPITLVKPHAEAGSILSERGPNQSSVAKVATWVGGVSIVVLLIACANVANLLLARALRRRREVAVRLALGVSRGRLLAQLLTESVVLAALGGVVGLLVAQFGGAALRTALLAKNAPVAVFRDPRTILFAGGAALLVGILTGLAPMFQTSHAGESLVDDLKAGAREGTNQRSRIRAVLLIIQGALSVVLLVGAGLFVRSLNNVRDLRLGYDVDPVMLVNIEMRGVTIDSVHAEQLRQRLIDAARSVPGVTHATLSVSTPFWSTWSTGLFVQGIDTVGRLGQFDLNAVSPDYFATYGTRVIRGRGFNDADSRLAPRVAVISDGMAKVLWPGREAIGQCMRVNADTMPCTTIVGITENIHQQSISSDSGVYMYYLPSAQQGGNNAGIALRVSGNAQNFTEAVRRRLQREMPGSSYITVTPFSEIIGDQTKSWEMGATMFVAFGALALVLAAVGLYSVIAYNVAQRTHEMGVRVALGAQVADVVRLVVTDGVKLGAVGLTLGLLVALGAARWVKPLLFNESPSDPLVLGFVAAVLLMVTVAASWIPARRAARVDPQVALRTE